MGVSTINFAKFPVLRGIAGSSPQHRLTYDGAHGSLALRLLPR